MSNRKNIGSIVGRRIRLVITFLLFLTTFAGSVAIAQGDESGSKIDVEGGIDIFPEEGNEGPYPEGKVGIYSYSQIFGRKKLPPKDAPCKRFFLVDNGRRFPCAEKGDPETTRTWLSPNVYFGPNSEGRSLAYETLEIPLHKTNTQKVMHEIHRSGDQTSEDVFRFNEKRYIGFAFRTAQDEPHAQAPQRVNSYGKGETLVFQLWQGWPFSPPVSAVLEDDGDRDGDGKGDLRMVFVVRNDRWPPLPCPGYNLPQNTIRVGGFQIERGHWYKFVVMVIPRNTDHDGDGELRIWTADTGMYHDGGSNSGVNWAAPLREIARWKGKIGYPQNFAPCRAGQTSKLNPHMIATVGLYRNYQPTRMKVFFDQIRVSTTYDAVEPYFGWKPID
jgi:hypothetical protein